MRIAINTRFLIPGKMEGFGWYTYEIAKRLVKNHPEHDFFFFFDRPFDQQFIFADNVKGIVLNPPARHPFLFIYWYEVAVKRALKKHKIDLFFSPDGYLSLKSDIPQVCVMHDLNFIHNPKDLKPLMSWYYNQFFPKFATKANAIITVSEFSRQDIIQQYRVDPTKVHAIWNGASDNFVPLDSVTKSKIRDKYCDGKPFILFVGSLHPRKNLKRLILAFEQFKLQNPEAPENLLIVGRELWKNGLEKVELCETIKASIRFTGHLKIEELARVTGSAEFLAFVPYFEGFGIPLVEAMRCGTPILAGDQTAIPEIAGTAAMYCDPFSVQSILSGIKALTSDETRRNELSAMGIERAQQFSWDKAADEVWKVLQSQMN